MAKPLTADGLSKQIKALERELFNAKVHFETHMGLLEMWNKYIRDIQHSPVFWQFTMKAHIETTVFHLCRVGRKWNGRWIMQDIRRIVNQRKVT